MEMTTNQDETTTVETKLWKKARLAVLAAFFVNGALLATWVSRIPAIQQKLNLSEGTLGLVLFGMGVGVLVALSIAGGLIGRFSSRTVTIAAAIAMCILLPFLALMPNPITPMDGFVSVWGSHKHHGCGHE